jgi:hypothetical protein
MAASRSRFPIGVVGPAELEVIDVLIALAGTFHFLGSGTLGAEVPSQVLWIMIRVPEVRPIRKFQ